MRSNKIRVACGRALHGSRARGIAIWLIAVSVAGLVAYLPTFIALAVGYTGGDSYYAHWFLVPPVSAFFVWLKSERLRQLPVQGWGWGLPVAAGSLLMHIFSVWFRIDFVSAFSLVVSVWGFALYLLGKRIVREISFPLLFLLFMVPLPGSLIAPIAFHMKIISGKMAVGLYNFFGGTAIITGSKITLGQGDPLWMGYECSGLKSVITLSALGAAIAFLVRASRMRRVLLFVASFPLAIISNTIRVASLCFAAERWGVNTKAYQVFHDVSSPVVFLIVLFGLFGIHKVLSLGDRSNKAQAARTPDRAPSPGAEGFLAFLSSRRLRTAFGLLGVCAILVFLSPHSLVSAGRMSSLKPVQLPELIGEWRKTEDQGEGRESDFLILKTKSIVFGSYENPAGNEVDLLVVASDTDRQAFHPPEICMIGTGNEVLERWEQPIGFDSAADERLKANAFVRGTSGRPETLVVYWYMADDRSTGSRLLQQLILLSNGARRVPAIGAMVRLTASLETMSREEAMRSASEFARLLLRVMPRVLRTARR